MDFNTALQQKALEWLEAGEALLSEQLPVLLQQVIAYGWGSNLTLLIGLTAILWVSIIPFRAYRVNRDLYYDGTGRVHYNVWWNGSEPSVMGGISMFFGGISTFSTTMCLMTGVIPNLVKLWLAPNLYVIEYLKHLT